MQKQITGLMVYYYFVCKRKLYYFCKNLTMESENEDVQLGKLLDETAYKKAEKHILINNTIQVDYIEKNHIIHEIKKSKSIEEAGIWQVKYYLWYLKQCGVQGLTGKIDYPTLRQTLTVHLTEDDEKELVRVLDEIKEVMQLEMPPPLIQGAFCKKCAYHDFCQM